MALGRRPRPLEIFRLRGTAVSPERAPIPGLGITIVDRDPWRDDLLGFGRTDARGSFRLSFTRSEFNQEPLENEALPDHELIFWVERRGERKALYQRPLPGLSFAGGEEDVGAIVVETWTRGNRGPLPAIEVARGRKKNVRHLAVDDELLRHCVAEVAPLVEDLTGWERLADGIELVRRTLGAGDGEGSLRERMLEGLVHRAFGYAASYDPDRQTIFVNVPRVARMNLDAAKACLGHELVHVGQFRQYPELSQRLDRLRADYRAGGPARELLGLMDLMESYAHYIQTDFLERHYNLATVFPDASMLTAVLAETSHLWLPDLDELRKAKAAQYTNALNRFRRAQRGDRPAPFTLDPRRRRRRRR